MPRIQRITLLALAGGVGLGGVVALLVVAFVLRAWWATPFEILGFGEAPEQPIAFPHTVHAGDLGLDCLFCHVNADQEAAASVPAVEQCVFCHKSVATESPEVMKLLDAWNSGEAIKWQRVYRLPDSVRFVHEAHIRFFTQEGNLLPSGEQALVASDVCSTCHGDVAQMEEVKQVRSLKMGDCVECHREYSAPTECTACHY